MKFTGIIIAAAILVSPSMAGVAAAKDKDDLSAEEYVFEHVSCTGAANEIRIIISGVKINAGLVTVDLYPNNEDGFLRGSGRIAQVHFAAKSPMTKLCITAPENGKFAMSAYHDQNANQKFDKNALGLPAEPWGLSNNPKVRLAPPPVEQALFDVPPNGGAHVHIKLN